MNCYLSTGVFPHSRMADIVAFCIEHEFDRVELSSAVAYAPDVTETVRKAHGGIRFLIHNYFPPPARPFVLNLAATDLAIRRRSIDLCRKAIALSAELEAPFYSVHAGFALHLTPEMLGDSEAQGRVGPSARIPREKAYERFVESVSELAAYGHSKGVQLLIENNVVNLALATKQDMDVLLLARADEILKFVSDVGDPDVGLLLDVGHAKVTAHASGKRPETFMELLAPHIRALHLSDNDGKRDSHLRFDDSAWFSPFLKNFSDVPIVIEVYRLSPDEIRQQRQVLAEMMT